MAVAEELSVFLSWAAWLCLWPERDGDGLFRRNVPRSVSKLLAIVLLYAYSLVGKLDEYFTSSRVSFALLVIDSTLVSWCNFATALGSCSWFVKDLQGFFDAFDRLDGLLAAEGFSFAKRMPRLKLLFALLNLTMVATLVLEVTLWMDEIYYFQFIVQDRLQIYDMFVVVFVEVNLLRHLLWRLQAINTLIDRAGADDAGASVDAAARLHGLCLDLIEACDALQGWHVHYTMLNCVVHTLLVFQDMLEPDFEWSVRTSLLMLIWTTFVCINCSPHYGENRKEQTKTANGTKGESGIDGAAEAIHPTSTMIVAATIQPLLRLGCFLGLLPSYNSKTRQLTKPRCYWYFVIVVFLATYAYSLLGKSKMEVYWGNAMKRVLSNVRSLLVNLMNILAILSSASNWGLGLLQRVFDDLNLVDRNLLAIHKTEVPTVAYFLQKLVGYNVLILTIMVADVYHWHLDVGADQYQFILNDSIQSYYLMTYVLLQLCLLRCLKKRFTLYNYVLDNLADTIVVSTVDSGKDESNVCFQLEALVKMQIVLSDICDAFNSLFGWHMLLHVFHITFNILSAIEIALDKLSSLHVSNIVLIFTWTIYFTAQGVFVATMCEQVSEEGKKTITISYKALNKYSNVPALREKLFILAQQATARCPKFTAAGFFSVDFSMLFTFVNLITTYVIVIIQFS